MQRHSAYAKEGFWLFAVCAVIAVVLAKFAGPFWALVMLLPMGLLIALFQDPVRDVPLRPLAVLSPVDGKVIDIGLCRSGLLDRQSLRMRIKVNHFGAYTVRAPVEGKLLDPRDNVSEGSRLTGRGGMWLRTDEGDDIVVTFVGRGIFGVPKSFRRYGERVGHGHRCAFLRLAPVCEVYLPENAMPRVQVGDPVSASVDPLARLRREEP
ncbi:MAG: hypothetical protein AAF004_00175 [Pseudomonadota bacterium]